MQRLQRPFRKVEDWGYHLHSQLPVTLGATQEPEPDLAIVRGRPEDYVDHHPQAADIVAIMEVADSSLAYDRTTKLAIYAGAGARIDTADVDKLVGCSRAENTWRIFDAIGAGQSKEALAILERLFDQGE